MATPRKPRLAIVVSHPIQYYAPLYRRLAERGLIDLHVVYLSDAGAKEHVDHGFGRTLAWDLPMLEGYAYTILQPGSDINGRSFWSLHEARLGVVLEGLSPDWILVYGYATRMNWAAVHWAKRSGVRVAYTSDSNIHDPKRAWVKPFKRLVLRYFFASVDVFLSTSEANMAYLVAFGARSERIHRLPFAIDVGRFRSKATEPGEDRPYDFIWAGKFIPLKRAGDFLMALAKVATAMGRPVKVCIAGDGPLRTAIEAQAAQLPAECVVTFLGFVNQAGMPDALRLAHALVLSSDREAYGLIAAEAAATGLALVVSDRVGCVGATVLARPGVNALTYRAGDTDGLAAAMQTLLVDTARRTQMQRLSSEIAQLQDMDYAAEVIEQVLRAGEKT